MQVSEPLKKKELVDLLHEAFKHVTVKGFEVKSDPEDLKYSIDQFNINQCDVAEFSYQNNESHPVTYTKDLQKRWEDVRLEGERVRVDNADTLERQLKKIKMRGDSTLSFITATTKYVTLAQREYGSDESKFLENIARYLKDNSKKIEKIAILTTDKNQLTFHEVQ